MLGYHCPDGVALFTEMRSAANEADGTAKIARDLIHASKPSEHVDGLRQIREQWENARRRWEEASTNLKIALLHTTARRSVAKSGGNKNKPKNPDNCWRHHARLRANLYGRSGRGRSKNNSAQTRCRYVRNDRV
jgi:hypothetical protein